MHAIHQTGSVSGAPNVAAGLDFFRYDAANAAASLAVVPTTAAGIAAGTPGLGASDGSNADKLAQLGAGKAVASAGPPPTYTPSPSTDWSNFVTSFAVTTRTELQHASLADLTSTAAVGAQLSNASVDLDEENVNLLMFQHAYQGAARVMTAVDEMLDTLINRTGLVGR